MRRPIGIATAVAVLGGILLTSASQAAFFSFPRVLRQQFEHLPLHRPALPPLAHSRFCLRYAQDCVRQQIDFRRRNITLTSERRRELFEVNHEVNKGIRPGNGDSDVASEEWLISPQTGNCHDYAVTKRHKLLALGWPSRALLLSEVVLPSGEHHLVLVVRTKEADLMLDNLGQEIRAVSAQHQYRWIRIESPANPKYWVAVGSPPKLQVSGRI